MAMFVVLAMFVIEVAIASAVVIVTFNAIGFRGLLADILGACIGGGVLCAIFPAQSPIPLFVAIVGLPLICHYSKKARADAANRP